MLTQWLIKKTISKSNKSKRQSYGYLGGIVGVIVNIILFVSKLIIGLLLNSVSIMADAFNNFSDVGSALVTIIGFKIADKPADKDHPFGHGRGEYVSGLIVSFMVVLVGFEFVKTSYGRIIHPVRLQFDIISFCVLLFSIIMKLWLGNFNKYLAKEISSGTLNATSFDSFADVITTSTVAASLLMSKFTTIPLDGYIGLVVSAFIIYTGYNLIKETINPLLGEAPDPELVNSIISEVMSYNGIIGAHDLIVHSYGSGKSMATIHAEIPSNIPVMEAHEIIDKAEREISKKLNVILVIHMDPINLDDNEINRTRIEIERILNSFPDIQAIHDFRIVGSNSNKNILFDAVISRNVSNDELLSLVEKIKESVKNKYPEYNLVIECDRDYTN